MATKLQDSLVRKIQENRELKDTVKDLFKQLEYDKDFYAKKLVEAEDQSNNLELALNKCILSKAELNDKVEQLQDDLDKYMQMYSRTKVVAQNLAEAVFFLTKDKQHG
jgi:chromosome segregation ATPase